MLWAFDVADCDSALDKLVLLALADEADDDGGSCYPSLRRISERTNLSQGAVRNHVATLEASGIIEVFRPAKTGRGHHNRYQLCMPRKGQETRVSSEETRSNDHPEMHIPVDPRLTISNVCVDCAGRVTAHPVTGVPNLRCKACHVRVTEGRRPAAQRPVGAPYELWEAQHPDDVASGEIVRETLSKARTSVQKKQ